MESKLKRWIAYCVLLVSITSCAQLKKSKEEDFTLEVVSKSELQGTLKAVRIPNTTLEIKEDADGGLVGGMYYHLVPKKGAEVISISYNKNADPNVMDDFYKEEVFLEVSNSLKEATLKDADLQKVKMLFGRFCYCKGETGYLKVNQGMLYFQRKGKSFSGQLDFKVENLPQLLEKVEFNIK